MNWERTGTEARGLLIIHTGNGKGKTTAALGMAMRAWGHGMRVSVLQFIKRAMPDCGEQDALQRIGIEIVALGAGFTFGTESTGSHREYAERLWKTAVEKINSAAYDMIVLDEFSYPLHYGWVPLGEAISVLKGRPPQLHVVITGRGVPPDLIAVADTVTEMKEVKHALRSGIHAQPGIEF